LTNFKWNKNRCLKFNYFKENKLVLLILAANCFEYFKVFSAFIYWLLYQSNSFKRNFHGSVNFFIILWNRFDIGVPTIFSSYLLHSLLLGSQSVPSLSEGIVCTLRETSLLGSLFIVSSSWWLSHLIPLDVWLSQEWNGICKLLRVLNFLIVFPFVGDISIKDEWRCINWCLKCALSWSHWWSVLRFILDTHCLNSFSSNRFWRCILSEEFWICHCGIVESYVVVHWTIKVLSVGSVSCIVVFGALDVEIRNPTKFTINISVFWDSRIIWHSCSFNLIHFIWVMFSSWLDKNWLFWLEGFVEVLLVVGVVSLIKKRWSVMMSLVPLIIIWS